MSSSRDDPPGVVVAADAPDPGPSAAVLAAHSATVVSEHLPSSESAVSAFLAVPHYPNVLEFHEGSGHRARRLRLPPDRVPDPGALPNPSSPSGEWYLSDSEMTDALSEMGGVPLEPYLGGHVGLAALSPFENPRPAPIASTLSSDTEDATDMIMDYEPSVDDRLTTLSEDDDPDDTHKFYSDDGDYGDLDDDLRARHDTSTLSEVDLEDFYQGYSPGYGPPLSDLVGSVRDDYSNAFSEGEDSSNADPTGEPHFADPVVGTTRERNLNVDQFIAHWLCASAGSMPSFSQSPAQLPRSAIVQLMGWIPPAQMIRPPGLTQDFDLQQIPWWDTLRIKRSFARLLRDQSYTSYHNLEYSGQRPGARLPQEEGYFRGKAMYTEHKASIEHFQLRNLMSVVAYNTVHFAHESKVYSWVPAYNDLTCLIDLASPAVESGLAGPVKISTMKSAHDLTIAGGFSGEYAVRGAGAAAQGYVTKDPNGITNHIDIVPSRTKCSPMGIFASNDRHLRVLDCETNTFVLDHELSRAINCTSTSPDGRLRVLIGDSSDAWVVEADTGRPVHPLRGHRDFGFACAWSPDMHHIATSNQDKSVIIWDARTWGMIQKIESDVAGYRSLRWSPVGGGPRTLLLCEPADRIAIVNAQTYQSRQVHDFFGEIGGADYAPDGSSIWVANTDEHFGGFLEYERRQWGQRFGLRDRANEWVRGAGLDEDPRCLLSERERQLRFLWNTSDEEHEMLLL
ncbi:YVTN repeat-like/Quino protein amine dehydrogenase [Aspergillus heteromorphus CBS 117.55]|uniref:YVTN repeat-like/Quino protein amine dehydrogenase n=1 Tax=Aspergillus heteromorphus CBS 117.55 TaxID=1448321 RepID=A0A317WYD2_9EURO|nr:YVTN repeat-like/Quino protein amine dehydrogenase [Aspergillus heteromorphus CBS 117.55]PWY89210.1 YVTN repeat-like/Quino protein amine dehydrogenase [Aspergillus heteromorphus CBS 117.55]